MSATVSMAPDYTHHVDLVNMIGVDTICDARRMTSTMGERLRGARKMAGFKSAMAAANRFGWPPSTYAAHENGQNQYDTDAAAKYAAAFKTTAAYLLTGESSKKEAPQTQDRLVKIVGIVGAGSSEGIEFLSEETFLGFAPVPSTWNIDTVALEVRGNSMRPMAYDGWYVYYDKDVNGITPDMIGEPCVIWLADGRVLIKIPRAGSEKNRYNLESVNPTYDIIENAEVKSSALVTAFIPRRAAKKIIETSSGEASI
ncbi:XRE family transcriptional regulator [Methylobacterium organophilum]|nr:S24 family peptidase [Methylobacterium organophilum]